MMKVAYVTTYDIFNRNSLPAKSLLGLWEAGQHISKNLTDISTSVDYIGPLNKKKSLLTRAKWSFYRHVYKKDYYRWAEPLIVKDYAKQVTQKLLHSDSDIVLCPENVIPIAYLQCKQPIVLWTDSTLSSLINFYPYMSNLCKETIKNVGVIEATALNRCSLAIYPSEWAAQNAIQMYGISPSKVKVVPWGANLECKRTAEDIRTIVESRVKSPCKLLFFGMDWFRKGGNVALEAAQELNKMGLETELTVVGCHPIIPGSLPKFVKVLGFIDKFTQEGEAQINQLLADCHFLILPSQAECYGIVFCEANSFGVPCLATNVGGIPTVVQDNLNGKIFPLTASALDYCNYIFSLMKNYDEYKKLALSSFEQYQSRLNWPVAVQTVKQLMKELIE